MTTDGTSTDLAIHGMWNKTNKHWIIPNTGDVEYAMIPILVTPVDGTESHSVIFAMSDHTDIQKHTHDDIYDITLEYIKHQFVLTPRKMTFDISEPPDVMIAMIKYIKADV